MILKKNFNKNELQNLLKKVEKIENLSWIYKNKIK